VGGERLWQLDALRGLMLVLMLCTHLPTNLGIPATQFLGFVFVAEGFFMLSAYMAGRIYTQRYVQGGVQAMYRAVWRRALVVYGYHVASLLFLFTVISALGIALSQQAVKNFIGIFLQEPVSAVLASLVLLYKPPLFDILPVYVLFLLMTPWVLSCGLRWGWRNILMLSGLLWLAAQFGLSAFLYGVVVAATGLTLPYRETGAFEFLGWQFLWVTGMWLGSMHTLTPPAQRRPLPPYVVAGAMFLGAVFFIWRQLMNFSAASVFSKGGAALNILFYKASMGPLRLLNLLVLVILVIHFSGWFKQHLPRILWLETLGRAALSVFCMHLVMVFLVLSVFGPSLPERALWKDGMLFGASVLVLYGVARWVESYKVERKDARARRSSSLSFNSVEQ
jgi:hypothetical protein